jgi:hypothetical protein
VGLVPKKGDTQMKGIRIAVLTVVLAAALVVAPTASPQPDNRQATFGNLIAALNNINVQIDRLNVLSNIRDSNVQVVNVEDVLSGNNIRALNNALNRNNVEILNLRNFLNNVLNNPNCSVVALCDVLNDADIVVSDVIAINVLSGGDVIIFEQPPALP